jgi:HSP20 family protein
MALVRWDPFQELTALQNRFSRALHDTLFRPATTRSNEELVSGTWTPPVDIVETSDRIVLKAELPGFKQDQVELTTENGMLTLRGERKFENETNEENYHRIERSYGTFVRSFALPSSVDTAKIQARFAEGVLTVEMPKREETKPKQIKITAEPAAVGGKKEIDVKAK